MRIIFFRTRPLRYYKGEEKQDPLPLLGGDYVKKYKSGGEDYNFDAESLDNDNEICFGYVQLDGSLHIERMSSDISDTDAEAQNVLVVWCATMESPDTNQNILTVVGWYQHATVYREYQTFDCWNRLQDYICCAKKENCVLLPLAERYNEKWRVPTIKEKRGYAFGHASNWFANRANTKEHKQDLDQFIDNLKKSIFEYDGENWIDTAEPTEGIKFDTEGIKRRKKNLKIQKKTTLTKPCDENIDSMSQATPISFVHIDPKKIKKPIIQKRI